MKKNKKLCSLLIVLFSFVFCAMCGVGLLTIRKVQAEEGEDTPYVKIYGYDLALQDNIYICYYVETNGLTEKPILKIWRDSLTNNGGNTEYKNVSNYDEAHATVLTDCVLRTVNGHSCYMFVYTELSAKQMMDKVYAKAECEGYYSNVSEYGIFKYCANKFNKYLSSTAEKDVKFVNLLTSILNYGKSAQLYFDYKTDNLPVLPFVSNEEELKNAIGKFGSIKLLNDITITADSSVVFPSKTETVLDLNGYTISGTKTNAYSGKNYQLIDVQLNAKLTVKGNGGSIELSGADGSFSNTTNTISLERGTLVIENATIINNCDNGINSAIDIISNTGSEDAIATLDNVEVISKRYGIRLFGNSPTGTAKAIVNNCEIEARDGVFMQQATSNKFSPVEAELTKTKITATRGPVYVWDTGTTAGEGDNVKLTIENGTTLTTTFVPTGEARTGDNWYADYEGQIVIDYTTAAKDGYLVVVDNRITEVTNESELVTAMANGGKIKVMNDITISDNASVILPANKKAVLDLNGYTIKGTQTESWSGKNYQLIDVQLNAKLTINGNDGSIVLDGIGDATFSNSTNTIAVQRGTLVVENATIINNSEKGISDAIDILSNTGSEDAIATLDNVKIISARYGIRLFGNSATGAAKLTTNGTKIDAKYGIFLHQATSKNLAPIEVELNTTEVKAIIGPVYLWDLYSTAGEGDNIKFTIGKGTTFTSDSGIPADANEAWYTDYEGEIEVDYATTAKDGYLVVIDKRIVEVTNESELVDALQNGGRFKVMNDIALGEHGQIDVTKTVSLDLNGKSITATNLSGEGYALIRVANSGYLRINDNTAEKLGKIERDFTGSSKNGAVIWVEGKLDLIAGTIAIKGSTSGLCFAVDVRPNAWGEDYENATVFHMYDGTVYNPGDEAIRLMVNSSSSYLDDTATCIIDGGVVNGWDAVFMHYDKDYRALTLKVNGGTLIGSKAAVRVYNFSSTVNVLGDDETPINITLNDGEFTSGKQSIAGTFKLVGDIVYVQNPSGADYMPLLDIKGDKANIRYIADGFYYDTKVENNYYIDNVEGLKYFRDEINAEAGYKKYSKKTINLMCDIDLENEMWTSIKANNASNAFTFDGNGHTIKNLRVSGEKAVGFFSYATSLTINNLKFDGATIKGINHVAVIAGNALCTKFDNCTVLNSNITTSVKDNDDGDKAGAIAGYTSAEQVAKITNCTVKNCTITGYRDVGVLVGYANRSKPAGVAEITGNTVVDCEIINDQTTNYKNYSTDDKFDVHEVVGEAVEGCTIENNTTTNVKITKKTEE